MTVGARGPRPPFAATRRANTHLNTIDDFRRPPAPAPQQQRAALPQEHQRQAQQQQPARRVACEAGGASMVGPWSAVCSELFWPYDLLAQNGLGWGPALIRLLGQSLCAWYGAVKRREPAAGQQGAKAAAIGPRRTREAHTSGLPRPQRPHSGRARRARNTSSLARRAPPQADAGDDKPLVYPRDFVLRRLLTFFCIVLG